MFVMLLIKHLMHWGNISNEMNYHLSLLSFVSFHISFHWYWYSTSYLLIPTSSFTSACLEHDYWFEDMVTIEVWHICIINIQGWISNSSSGSMSGGNRTNRYNTVWIKKKSGFILDWDFSILLKRTCSRFPVVLECSDNALLLWILGRKDISETHIYS